MLNKIKKIRRKLLRKLKLRPIHKVIRLLEKNNFLNMSNTLEVFGYTGEYHTLDYLEHVNSLDIWEIDRACEKKLKENLPTANVKITNSYIEIKSTNKLFNTIIIDNHQGIFGDDKCEHFEIIEDCFQKLENKGVIIANVIPNILISKYETPKEIREKHIERRKHFYGYSDGGIIPLDYMENFYKNLALKNGYKAEHVFFVTRNYLMTYVVLCLKKI